MLYIELSLDQAQADEFAAPREIVNMMGDYIAHLERETGVPDEEAVYGGYWPAEQRYTCLCEDGPLVWVGPSGAEWRFDYSGYPAGENARRRGQFDAYKDIPDPEGSDLKQHHGEL